MNPENIENNKSAPEEGGDEMTSQIHDTLEKSADVEEAELHEWNKKRGGYMEGTQTQLVALHTGIFGNTLEFIEDGEHDKEIQDLIGKEDLASFWKLREIYFTAQMTPVEWHKSAERVEFYKIIEKVAQHPGFRKYIMRGLDQEDKTLH